MNKISPDRVPRRRWFRFSLRTLLLLVTVLGVWLGLHLQAVRRQKESIAAIKDIGGWCYYDFQDRSAQQLEPDLTATSPFPNWLRGWLGDDFFHNITAVNLVYQDDPNGGYEEIYLDKDDDINCLAGFPKLKMLALREGPASNENLSHIAKLSNLEVLFILDAHSIDDEGVAHLLKLRLLKFISIENSQITDESLKILATMPSLESLCLQGNRFNNRGLKYLSDMTRLKSLSIGRGNVRAITDDGLMHLQRLVNLEELDLQGTSVTAAGLKHLKNLKKLKKLDLKKTNVGDASELQAALPNCKIDK